MNDLNLTFEIKDKTSTKQITFYQIEAITTNGTNAVIISGGKEYVATATYPELWETLKRKIDESHSR